MLYKKVVKKKNVTQLIKGGASVAQTGGCGMPNGAVVPEGVAGCRSPIDGHAVRNGMVNVMKRESYNYDYGGGRMNRYAEPPMRPRRPSYNPNRYYGGNSESKEALEKSKDPTYPIDAQAGGKSKKSKKSRRSIVDYGSMMLYGGKQEGGKRRKSKKPKKSRRSIVDYGSIMLYGGKQEGGKRRKSKKSKN